MKYAFFKHSLFIVGFSGLVGVLLDLDHVRQAVWNSPRIGRPAHIPILFVFGGLCVFEYARMARLRLRSLL